MHRLLILAALVPGLALAQVPQKLGYQGRLLKADGAAESGSPTFTFAIFDAANAGNSRWSEQQTLALSDGYYATFLGSVTALPANLFDGADRWLEISVNGTALSPRQPIATVPYALTCQNLSGGTVSASSISASTLVVGGGNAVSLGATGISINGTSIIDSTGKVAGTVGSVGATAPLSSSGGTTPTLSIAQAGASGDGYLSSADWAAFNGKVGAVTATAPLASSGGTSPALSIAKANGSSDGYLSFADWNAFSNKAPGSGSASYIQNQSAAAQAASFSIDGSGSLGSLAISTPGAQARLAATGAPAWTGSGLVSFLSSTPTTLQGDANTKFLVEIAVGDILVVNGDTRLAMAVTASAVTVDLAMTGTGFVNKSYTVQKPVAQVFRSGSTTPALTVNALGNVGIGTSVPNAALAVNGTVAASADLSSYGASTSLVINVRAILTKAAANGFCPTGSTAIYTPRSYLYKTGDQICAANAQPARTCAGVKFVYVTAANGNGAYPTNDQPCTASLGVAWPWGWDYPAPDTLDSEWSHGDTFVVCCK